MVRALMIVAILSPVAAWAEPRLAVHPLEVSVGRPAEREKLKAQFDVMVARVPGVKLAGSAGVENALSNPSAAGCEHADSCLRFLADATGSSYALYARLDEAGALVSATARVVRTDGAIVRKVHVESDSARDALLLALGELNLPGLDSAAPTSGITLAGLTPPPMPPPVIADARPVNGKRVAGLTLAGAGLATAATGGVFAGLAASRAAANRPDESGAVTAARVEGAAIALRQEQVAAALLPIGAALTVVGAIILFWPSSTGNGLSLRVTPGGASVSGALP